LIETYEADIDVARHLRGKLISIETRDYYDITKNVADGRIVNDFTMTKTDMRRLLKYKKSVQVAVVDMRSSHPTYLGVLFRDHSPPLGDPYCHALGEECDRWTSFFTGKDDPKDIIAAKIGSTRVKVKSALIQIVNGEFKWYDELMAWFQSEYPLMYDIYMKMSNELRKDIGCRIAARYETNLILDPELYRTAENMGLKLGYENDGFAIFSDQPPENLKSQVEFIAKWITQTSERRFGVPVVIKTEILS
jgi:hypothetical protein